MWHERTGRVSGGKKTSRDRRACGVRAGAGAVRYWSVQALTALASRESMLAAVRATAGNLPSAAAQRASVRAAAESPRSNHYPKRPIRLPAGVLGK